MAVNRPERLGPLRVAGALCTARVEQEGWCPLFVAWEAAAVLLWFLLLPPGDSSERVGPRFYKGLREIIAVKSHESQSSKSC